MYDFKLCPVHMTRLLFRHPWLRRGVTLSVLTGAFVALTTLMIPGLMLAGLYDKLARRTKVARFYLFLWAFCGLELWGIGRSVVVRLRYRDPAARVDAHFALQVWWAKTLLGLAARLFHFTFDVRGDEVLQSPPYILMMRHASVADTLLPAVFAQYAFGARLRYVLKQELLLDPCLDIVGNALPNCFVQRGQGGAGREQEKIKTLTHDLGQDGIVIFPEGTRFTARKRERLLSKIAAGNDDARLARAAELQHVLPPRRGGALQLLDSTSCDVVFCAHSGFETIEKLSDLWRPALWRTRVELRFWRVPRADIPPGESERADWLFAQWQRVDEQIEGMMQRRLHASASP